MTFLLRTLATFVFLWFAAPYHSIAGPYIEFGVGVHSRDVVEEGVDLSEDAKGNADSTRVIAEIGWNFYDRVEIYGNIGGADLSVDDFDNFNSDFNLALGGGLKVNWYTAPGPSKLTFFTDARALTFETEDTISTCLGTQEVVCTDPARRVERLADGKVRWNEYAVKFGASFVHSILDRPYFGIRISKLDGNDSVTIRPDPRFTLTDVGRDLDKNVDLKEDDNFGLFAGTTLFFDQQEKAGLNLELNLIDEYSFVAAFRLNF